MLDSLEKIGQLENTLIYYIIGDNGASAEGTLNGTYNEMINLNGAAAIETAEFLSARLDKLGGPDSYNHFAVGWAHSMNTSGFAGTAGFESDEAADQRHPDPRLSPVGGGGQRCETHGDWIRLRSAAFECGVYHDGSGPTQTWIWQGQRDNNSHILA